MATLGVSGAEFAGRMEHPKRVWHARIERSCVAIWPQTIAFGLLLQFSARKFVFGMKIAQQSISNGDNCTPLRGFFIYLSLG